MKNSYNLYSFSFNPSVLGADKLWNDSATQVDLKNKRQT